MCSIISLFPRKLRWRTTTVVRDIMKISRCKLQFIFYQELIYKIVDIEFCLHIFFNLLNYNFTAVF